MKKERRARNSQVVEKLQPVLLAAFSEVLGDQQHLIAVSVGIDLSPVLLSLARPPDYRTVATSGVSFAKKRANRPNQFSIHYLVKRSVTLKM